MDPSVAGVSIPATREDVPRRAILHIITEENLTPRKELWRTLLPDNSPSEENGEEEPVLLVRGTRARECRDQTLVSISEWIRVAQWSPPRPISSLGDTLVMKRCHVGLRVRP